MKKAIGVKLLNKYIRSELSQDPILRNIYVMGEVTNLRKNKYTYFDLKEDDELINCVYFANDLDFDNGDSLILSGSISIYSRASRYQIHVKSAQVTGQGQAYYLLQKLKEKLDKKGYFDSSRKKNIPLFPHAIGLVTSSKSAAVVDFLSILKENYPIAHIYLYHTSVQGIEANLQIIEAINRLDKMKLDLIVITRGGGSNEDLSIFNDEKIASTIYEAKTPIISAVGHEIDTTITDLVSDLRLSTPTKAAEYIIKNFVNSKLLINNLHFDLKKSIDNLIEKKSYLLDLEKFEIENNSPLSFIDMSLSKLLKLEKNNLNIVSTSLYKAYDEINTEKSKIEDEINRILHENMMKILDLDQELVDVNNLAIDKDYFMQNDKVKYRIRILEKLDG
ncbi:MAG: exodeoxyribonuclease VII large subunit [Tissierellia bacterium]|nr:exodeoxyribonuclease VII large subunit [Tissierellia bacterium]